MSQNKFKHLAILGAGGHAKVVLNIAQLSKQYDQIMIFDDAYQADPVFKILQCSVAGDSRHMLAQLEKNLHATFIIAIGNNGIRATQFSLLSEHNLLAASPLFHPSSVIAESSVIGKGSVVMANAVINPDAVIGENVIINTAAVIEHDCRVGNHVHIAPRATLCGGSTVGDYTWIGAGAVITQYKHVGKNCMIGAGAVVTDDIPDNTLALGVPAKSIRKTMEVT